MGGSFREDTGQTENSSRRWFLRTIVGLGSVAGVGNSRAIHIADDKSRRDGERPHLHRQTQEEPAISVFEFNDQELPPENQRVTIAAFESNHGGFIRLYDERDESLGQSAQLAPGSFSNVEVTLDRNLGEGAHELTAVAYTTQEVPYNEERTATMAILDVAVQSVSFRVTDTTPMVDITEPDDSINISTTIVNTNDIIATQPLEITLDGEVVSVKEITIEGGESQEVDIELDKDDLEYGQRYEYTVATADSSETGVLNVGEKPESPDTDDDDSGLGIQGMLAAGGGGLLVLFGVYTLFQQYITESDTSESTVDITANSNSETEEGRN